MKLQPRRLALRLRDRKMIVFLDYYNLSLFFKGMIVGQPSGNRFRPASSPLWKIQSYANFAGLAAAGASAVAIF
jgi:hypothetical protein